MSAPAGAAVEGRVTGPVTSGRARPTGPARRALAYLPAVVAVLACLAVLSRYGTPVPVAVAFLLYLGLMVALPGTLVWRAVRGDQVSFTEDVALGSAVGLAVQVLLALALAPFGLSGWSWVWAPVAVALTALHPRLRRVWSRPTASPGSALGAWVQAGAVVAAAVWLGATAMANNMIAYVDGSGPWSRGVPVTAYVDLPFHHAIASGVMDHFPLVYPYLYDEPLRYHLFVYEHLAGAAAVTGIDLTWLVYRLDTLPLVALGIVLAGVLARRLSGIPAAAPLAAAVVTLSAAVPVYGWIDYPFQNPGFLHFATYRSPTQTFGIPLFLAAVTVTVMLVRDERRGWRGRAGLLATFAVLALAAGGSKSTFLPVLVCGLLLALAVSLLLRDRRWRMSAGLTAGATACFAFVAVVLLGGAAGSLTIAPLNLVHSFALTQQVADPALTSHRVLMLGLGLVSWLLAGAGVVLLATRRTMRDPALWLVVGVAVAGVCGSLLTSANGLSQLYFLYAAWPVLGVLSAWGLAAAVRRAPRAGMALVTGALLAGVVVLRLVQSLDGPEAPERIVPLIPLRALGTPWLVLLAMCLVLACAAAGARLVRRRPGGLPPVTVALVVLVGLLVGGSLAQRSEEVVAAARAVVGGTPGSPEGWPVPRDGALAALLVRDTAAADDVVATNAHCYGPPEACDARHFWVAALTERRVLLEGWAYPEGFRPGQTRTSPFWDQERYAHNEAVFTDPSQDAVDLLADRYGVRWLLVDRTISVEDPALARYATLVHETDGAAVYRID
ncbi:hypothetical protein [Actinotalea sp. JY-7885]|uniref:hypothetical protein n=1 Tax=Actinotalea sp. JY-7885 TaxID=2758576 RepID=UPI00165E50D2|nr:hypothetical protein [Actinotalea sp. JY-7885]